MALTTGFSVSKTAWSPRRLVVPDDQDDLVVAGEDLDVWPAKGVEGVEGDENEHLGYSGLQ